MSEGPVASAGTAPGAVPNGPAPTATPTPTAPPAPAPTAPPATGTVDDDAAAQKLYGMVNGQDPAQQRTPEQELAHWKEMARKNEQRAAENFRKAKQFDEIEEANKTELQKAQERAERAEQAAALAQAQSLKASAVLAYELDPSLAQFITGSTEAEINASAESLARVINERAEALANSRNGNGGPQRTAEGRPVESMRPGAYPSTSSTTPPSTNQVFRGMLGRS